MSNCNSEFLCSVNEPRRGYGKTSHLLDKIKEHLYEQFGITFDKEVYSFMGDFIDEVNMKLKPFGWEIDYKNREVSIFWIKKQNREIL